MSSNLPGQCCTEGVKWEGTPKGSIKKAANVNIYFSEPEKSNGKALIFLSDIFGFSLNAKLLADDFASKGYLTVIPDILHDDAIDAAEFEAGKIDLMEWVGRHGPDVIDPVIDAVVKHLREDLKIEKIGALGYCFGAKYVVRNLKDRAVDVGFIAHPSFITSEELSAITKPLSIAAAETDPVFPSEKRHESEKILADLKLPYEINLYGGVVHGFAVRGELSDPRVKYAANRAFDQAVTWFNYWL